MEKLTRRDLLRVGLAGTVAGVGLASQGCGPIIAGYVAGQTYAIAQREQNSVGAELKAFWYEPNARNDQGISCIGIHTRFSTRNLRGVPLQLGTYFYDMDGRKLAAQYNSRNRTTDGQIAIASDKFTPAQSDWTYDNVTTKIPYSEFRLPPGVRSMTVKCHTDLLDLSINSVLFRTPFMFIGMGLG